MFGSSAHVLYGQVTAWLKTYACPALTSSWHLAFLWSHICAVCIHCIFWYLPSSWHSQRLPVCLTFAPEAPLTKCAVDYSTDQENDGHWLFLYCSQNHHIQLVTTLLLGWLLVVNSACVPEETNTMPEYCWIWRCDIVLWCLTFHVQTLGWCSTSVLHGWMLQFVYSGILISPGFIHSKLTVHRSCV